jgi:hypothetical protein
VPGAWCFPPEQAKQAWELEVKHLAATIGMNSQQTAEVTKAYSEARDAHAKGLRELTEKFRPQRGEDGQYDPAAQRTQAEEMRKAFETLNTTQRENLKAALTKALTAEQVEKAVPPLTAFNPNWDAAVITIQGFNLDAGKNTQSMDALLKYVTTIGKAMGSENRDALRTANQTARRELSETMKPLLSEEQYGQLQRALAGGQGQFGGSPRGGTGGEGGRTRSGRGGAGGTGGGTSDTPER